jgi:hypothetical protein
MQGGAAGVQIKCARIDGDVAVEIRGSGQGETSGAVFYDSSRFALGFCRHRPQVFSEAISALLKARRPTTPCAFHTCTPSKTEVLPLWESEKDSSTRETAANVLEFKEGE